MNRLVWALCLACLTSAACAQSPAPQADRDTLSPAYDFKSFPYSWQEIQSGKYQLAPVHFERTGKGAIVKPGMNSRPIRLDENTIRMYYGISGPTGGIFYFDVDGNNPTVLKQERVGPLVSPGEAGTYDDEWVICPEPVRISDTHIRLYYSAKKKGPFFGKVWSLCAADSTDNGKTFQKYEGNPILTVTDDEWQSGAVGFCSVEKNDDGWKMWYLGTDGNKDAKKQVGYATSSDGYKWDRYAHNPVLGVDPNFKWEAGAIAVPRVIRDGKLYRVWYCCYEHNKNYAIGQAESVDGIKWFRSPHNPVLEPGNPGFDSGMTAYPGTIRFKDRYLMWYTGNGYGVAGIGMAWADVPAGAMVFRTGTSEKPDDTWSKWQPVTGDEPSREGFVQFAVISPGASSSKDKE